MKTLSGYTRTITFYKKVQDLGWTYCDFRTTEDALKTHLKSLAQQEAKGTVRAITFSRSL